MTSTSAGPGSLAYAEETDRMARANHRLALSNYENIWPWRYFKWRRVHREVKRVQGVVRDRLNVHAQAMGWEREL